MLVGFNVTQLAKWGYTNDTVFIDPMQPEFRPKTSNDADNTDEAIRSKIAWFYSTNAYNRGDVEGVESAIRAYKTGEGRLKPSFVESYSMGSLVATQTQNQTEVASQTQAEVETTTVPGNRWVVTMRPKPWFKIISKVSTTVIDTMTIVGTYGVSVPTGAVGDDGNDASDG